MNVSNKVVLLKSGYLALIVKSYDTDVVEDKILCYDSIDKDLFVADIYSRIEKETPYDFEFWAKNVGKRFKTGNCPNGEELP